MSEKKTRQISIKTMTGKQSRQKLKKIHDLFTPISTNNITESNELIYAETKLVSDKIGVPLKNMNRNSKPGWEILLERRIRNLR